MLNMIPFQCNKFIYFCHCEFLTCNPKNTAAKKNQRKEIERNEMIGNQRKMMEKEYNRKNAEEFIVKNGKKIWANKKVCQKYE